MQETYTERSESPYHHTRKLPRKRKEKPIGAKENHKGWKEGHFLFFFLSSSNHVCVVDSLLLLLPLLLLLRGTCSTVSYQSVRVAGRGWPSLHFVSDSLTGRRVDPSNNKEPIGKARGRDG